MEPTSSTTTVKLSIRLTAAEATLLADGAASAGLSRGAYLAGLIAGVPVLTDGANRTEHLAALVASTAELSGLTRNIHQLCGVLGERATKPALTYRVMLDGLSADVRRHLMQAARAPADLQPNQRKS